MSPRATRGYTTTIDTTRVEQNPGQKTLQSNPSVPHPLVRTTDTPPLPVESRRRPRVVPTATTRCGNRPLSFLARPHPFILGRILLSTNCPLPNRFHCRYRR